MAGRAQSRSRFLFGIEFTIQTYRVGRPRTITRLIVPRPSTADEEDTVHFAELTGVHPMIETYPLDKAAEGYARMMSGEAQFRVVLTVA